MTYEDIAYERADEGKQEAIVRDFAWPLGITDEDNWDLMDELRDAVDADSREVEDATFAPLATCGGCGSYGPLGRTCVNPRTGEECGTYA